MLGGCDSKGGVATAIAEGKEGDATIERLLKAAGMKYNIDKDGDFQLAVRMFDESRTHIVWITSKVTKYLVMDIRKVWAYAYMTDEPFSKEIANQLLEENFKMKFGSWQCGYIGALGSKKRVAIFELQLTGSYDADVLAQAIYGVALAADNMEKVLTDGADAF
jgi:hypothetical protein